MIGPRQIYVWTPTPVPFLFSLPFLLIALKLLGSLLRTDLLDSPTQNMQYEAIYTCYASQQSLLLQKGHRRGTTTTKTFLKYWLSRSGGRFVNGLLSVKIFALSFTLCKINDFLVCLWIRVFLSLLVIVHVCMSEYRLCKVILVGFSWILYY